MTAVVAGTARPGLPELRESPPLHRHLPGLATALDADAVRPRLQAMLDPAQLLLDCTPRTVRFRGPAGCDLRYAVRSRHRATGAVETATVLGRVLPAPDRIAGYRARIDPLLPAVAHRLGPFALAASSHPDLALVLHVFPVDAALPTLAAATDPRRLRQELPATFDRAGCAVEVIRHARDGRCALRYTFPDWPAVYGKVHADASGAAQRALLARLGPALATDLRVPHPLGYAAAIRTLVCAQVPGTPAHLTDPAQAPRLVAAAARAAAALHAAPVVASGGRSLAGDAMALRAELDLLRPLWPEPVALLRAELAGLTRWARDTQAPVLVHGDLTPSQLLTDQGGCNLVDFDAAAMAEPALDLGRFRCYLRLTLAKAGRGTAAPALADAFLAAYLDAARPGRAAAALPARIALSERLSLLRVATNACRTLKSDRLATALSLL